MRPGLQLKISQQLTMTPQLQQAIRLLQLSTLELRQEVIEQLYNNPLLEIDEDNHQPSDSSETETNQENVAAAAEQSTEIDVDFNSDDPSLHSTASDASEATITATEDDSTWENETPANLPVDANWDEIYSAPAPTSSGGEVNLEQIYQVTESLQDHLHWQLNLTPFSDRDREIAEAFIDAIDNSGMISHSLEEIVAHIEHKDPEEALQDDELIAVLHRLQQFDPPGIFGRDIKECLLIQLNQLSFDTPHIIEARRLVSKFLHDIASVDLSRLIKKTDYSADQVQGALLLIRSLNPRPGESLSNNDAEYIVPDVFVEKVSGRWRVQLNDSNMPRLRINDTYSNMIKRLSLIHI